MSATTQTEGLASAVTDRARGQREVPPMTDSVYGERRPVSSGTRRVPGLYERDLAGGRVVFDARLRLGGRVRRFALTATTKTDAIAELRALQVDHERGDLHRSTTLAPTLAELAADYVA